MRAVYVHACKVCHASKGVYVKGVATMTATITKAMSGANYDLNLNLIFAEG